VNLTYWWNTLCLQWHQGMHGLYADQQAECERKWKEAVRRQRREEVLIGRRQSKLLATDRARELARNY